MSGVTTIQRRTRSSRCGQPHVAVVEHRGGVEQDFKDQDGDGRRAERRHHAQLDPHRQQNLDRMKAYAGRNIELEVGVVHAMQAPEGRHRMEQNVLEIDGQIEQDDAKRDCRPSRQVEGVEQSPASGFGQQRQAQPRQSGKAAARGPYPARQRRCWRASACAGRSSGRDAAPAVPKLTIAARMRQRRPARMTRFV